MTLPTNEQFDELDELHARILGRSKFCRCRGEVKTPDLLDECAAQHIADAKRIAELEAEIERLTNTTAEPVVKATHYSTGLCGCCGVRPIAYSIAGECIDCFSENEAAE